MSSPLHPQSPAPKRDAAIKIVSILREHNHIGYFAGGCVRDMLRNVQPKDFDVVTDARPDQVAAIFHNTRAVGEAFGVMLVRLLHCDVEVATFRTEWGYTDGRRPDRVEFSDAEHDARRRDFTINGLFYDPVADQVLDYVDGRADIDRRIIRAIGNPDERFDEDYLRMLRAVRFSARLDFTIEDTTRQAILRHAPKLAKISRERIGMEAAMMLCEPTRATSAAMIQQFNLDAPMLDEPHSDKPLPGVLAALWPEADYPTALAAWILDRHISSPADLPKLKAVQLAQHWRDALVLSNEQTESLTGLLRTLPKLWNWPNHSIAQKKRLVARGDWDHLLSLLSAMTTIHPGFDLDSMRTHIQQLRSDGIGIAPTPFITGDDLTAAGLTPGPIFKHLLDDVYDAQLDGRIAKKSDALDLARRLYAPGKRC